ncbi:MAG: DUF502 domain-containing protein [Saprospiraceae bacterium]
MKNSSIQDLTNHAAVNNTKIIERLISTIISGFLSLLPLIAVGLIFIFLLSIVNKIVSPLSLLISNAINGPIWIIDVFSTIIIAFLFLVTGLLIEDRWCKLKISRFEESYLYQLPFYSSFRDTVRRFSGKEKMPFSQVALVDVYNTGVLSTAFVTDKISEDLYTVFVPTAPNPTNGYIFHVPVEKLQFIDTSPDIAMRSVIAMGTGSRVLFEPPVAKEIEMHPPQQMVG